MNPAALKANLAELERGATIIVNEDAFTQAQPGEGRLRAQSARGRVAERVPGPPDPDDDADDARGRGRSRTPRRATRVARRTCSRSACCRGCTAARPTSPSAGSSASSPRSPAVAKANLAAFNAGWSFGETTELLDVQYRVNPATDVPPGHVPQRQRDDGAGARADRRERSQPACRWCSPATRSRPPPSSCTSSRGTRSRASRRSRPRTRSPPPGWRSAPPSAAALGVTATSGPGMDLKAETIGLAVMLELPLVVIDVQRAGPSTGMPTKTEQSDLLMALYGRHGESPLPVVAPSTPGGCFDAAFEAVSHRGPLPHTGDPAVGHVPGLVLGAVADPGRRRPAGRSTRRSRPRQTDGEHVHALRRDERARPAVGDPRHARVSSTGSAGSRRPTAPATSPTTAPTTSG